MGSINSVQIMGHLGNDADLRTLQSGSKVTKFSVALNETYTNYENELVQKTTWVQVEAWGGHAPVCASLKKGNRVLVNGRLAYREWTGADAVKVKALVVMATEVHLLDRFVPPGDAAAQPQTSVTGDIPPIPDDLPF